MLNFAAGTWMKKATRHGISAAALLFSFFSTVEAQSGRAVTCPPFIAEKADGIFYPRKNYRCFSTSRQARRAGFINQAALVAPDYTGWWRFNLTLRENSCGGPNQSSSATTYFLQVKQDQSGVFGALCPGNELFVGATPARDPVRGVSLATQATVSSDSFCSGGPAMVSYSFEASGFDSLYTDASKARLTRQVICLQSGVRRCLQRWDGAGGRETTDHRFWPQVSNDLSQLGFACGNALRSCQQCHGG